MYKEDDGSENGDKEPNEDLEIYEKMEWNTMNQCKQFMRKHAIFKKFEYKQKKNNKLQIYLHCKVPSCKWRVLVRKKPHEHTARLRKYVGQHTCKSDDKCKNVTEDARWVAGETDEDIRNHKFFKPRDVIAKIWSKHGLKISYDSAYNTKLKCHENIYGKYDESYRLCPEICRQILDKNPGSVAEWLRNPIDNRFVRWVLYCFQSIIRWVCKGL